LPSIHSLSACFYFLVEIKNPKIYLIIRGVVQASRRRSEPPHFGKESPGTKSMPYSIGIAKVLDSASLGIAAVKKLRRRYKESGTGTDVCEGQQRQ
jgi:hypothetical protein